MKRFFLITLAALLLAGIGMVAWTAAGLPPVRMVWRFGFSYGPEPTGRTVRVKGIEFVEIGPGCFRMGSEFLKEESGILQRLRSRLGLPGWHPPMLPKEMPVHWVEFSSSFWISRTEVTNRQYRGFEDFRYFRLPTPGEDGPRTDVTWHEAKRFCAWLSEQTGLDVRLPSEAEWECACRAGSDDEFSFGEQAEFLGDYDWYEENSGERPWEVGELAANRWGLYDMHGNVIELCEDAYHPNFVGAPDDGSPWIEGGQEIEGVIRGVSRGGFFGHDALRCRSAVRWPTMRDRRDRRVGFRLALETER